MNLSHPVYVGVENPRESRRFRFPLVRRKDALAEHMDWPWMALFENADDAQEAARMLNDFPRVDAEAMRLRRYYAQPVEMFENEGYALPPKQKTTKKRPTPRGTRQGR